MGKDPSHCKSKAITRAVPGKRALQKAHRALYALRKEVSKLLQQKLHKKRLSFVYVCSSSVIKFISLICVWTCIKMTFFTMSMKGWERLSASLQIFHDFYINVSLLKSFAGNFKRISDFSARCIKFLLQSVCIEFQFYIWQASVCECWASEPVSSRQERSHLNYYNRQLQRNKTLII